MVNMNVSSILCVLVHLINIVPCYPSKLLCINLNVGIKKSYATDTLHSAVHTLRLYGGPVGCNKCYIHSRGLIIAQYLVGYSVI